MSLFVLDTSGDQKLLNVQRQDVFHDSAIIQRRPLDESTKTKIVDATKINELDDEDIENDDGDYFGLPPPNVDLSKIINSTLSVTTECKSKVVQDMCDATEMVDAAVRRAREHPNSKRKRTVKLDYSDFNQHTGKMEEEKSTKINVEKELQSSKLVSGFEQLKELPIVSERKRRELVKIERSKTKGASWFNLPATEVTDELQNELKIIQMRSVLDPKHFYKKNDLKVLPKYFQVGTVQHSPLDYYSERNSRKTKKSLVDELLADEAFQKFNKRKYEEVTMRRDKYAHRKAMKKMKKLKKNK